MKKAFSLIELSIVILIIGILIAGVTQGSRLSAQFRLSSARAQTQSSPVVSINGLTFWLEATSEKSFKDSEAENNALLSAWYNINPQSVTNYDMVQTGGTIYQPYYRSAGLNNLPAVYFDGTGRTFNNPSVTIGDLIKTNEVTFFVVQKINNSNSTVLSWVGSGDTRFSFHVPYSDGNIHFDFGTCCSAVSRLSVTAPAGFSSAANVMTFVKKPNGDAYINQNGAQIVSVTTTMTGSINLGLNNWMIIGDFSGGGASFSGYIGEIIIFNRSLKSEEVDSVEQYLGKKWGIKTN
jgi:prepilin-type N-terminal cleavage/methylation domain-containing protein